MCCTRFFRCCCITCLNRDHTPLETRWHRLKTLTRGHLSPCRASFLRIASQMETLFREKDTSPARHSSHWHLSQLNMRNMTDTPAVNEEDIAVQLGFKGLVLVMFAWIEPLESQAARVQKDGMSRPAEEEKRRNNESTAAVSEVCITHRTRSSERRFIDPDFGVRGEQGPFALLRHLLPSCRLQSRKFRTFHKALPNSQIHHSCPESLY